MGETVALLFRGLHWIGVLLTFGIAIAAVGRLKLTPTGALFGVGFTGLAFKGAALSLYSIFVFRPALEDDSGTMDAHLVYESYRWVNMFGSVAGSFLWVLIGIGAAMLPFSLKRLREKG